MQSHAPTLNRIAIVNRGEAAMRLIHAVRDVNARRALEGGAAPLRTIALYTDVDAGAAFVREADEAYLLGPAAERPYLDLAALEQALVSTDADACWVGWGFVAEDPAFAQLCERLGVRFIGPSAEAMRRLGDKIGSKLIAEEVGVPVAPWSRGGVDTLEAALEAAERVGYPMMLKATAGGGGRGIRKVSGPAELEDAYQRTRDEAQRAFGSGVVFLEKLVTGARHVEVQVIADGQGTAWAVGVRDCSVQRRNQKIIEESASPLLDEQQTGELKAAAERLALAVDYRGAGTVEFLYHPQDRTFAFLEVNTRLQVEHPITESVTGLDLVGLQLQVAAGEPLRGDRPAERGHAVEARLNAEDADRDFAPAPGRISRLELPAGPGIRVDTGVNEGDTIPADFDSMIAKIIAHGSDRAEALARLRRAMQETTVIIDGGVSNKSFVLELLDQPEVTRGEPHWADTGWIDRERAAGGLADHPHAGVALVAAAIEGYAEQERADIAGFLDTAYGGRAQVHHDPAASTELKLRGESFAVTVRRVSPRDYTVTLTSAGTSHTVGASLEHLDEVHSRLTVDGDQFRVVTAAHGPTQLIEVNGVTHRISRDEGGVLRAPAPALVVATPVPVGEEVGAGEPVLVLESMKMETVVPAPFAGRVRELLVRPGTQVETGAALIRLEPSGEETEPEHDSAPSGLGLPVDDRVRTRAQRDESAMDTLRSALMGYDVAPSVRSATLRDYLQEREPGTPPSAAELALLDMFADFAELSRNRPARDEVHGEVRVHSSREHFQTYLRTLDLQRGNLPESFEDKLLRVLRHYGIHDLDRTPQLEEALFRVFLAQQDVGDVDIAVQLLRSWLTEPAPTATSEARALLDRVVRATQRRFAVVGDLARSVRFGWFDQPVVDIERSSVLGGVADEIAALADPGAEHREQRIEALSAIPEQLVPFLRDRLYAAGDRVPGGEPMLEVLVRRHYLEYDLRDLQETSVDGRPVTSAEYHSDVHGQTRVLTTTADIADLRDGSLAALIDERSAPDHDTVVEVYLRWADAPPETDTACDRLLQLLGEQRFAHVPRRISFAVCPPAPAPIDYLTFRPAGDGAGDWVEDDLIRGMHPMVGRRLNLWRLRDFDLTRLEAPEDVLLLDCVARSNPADRRLVAMSQVRQLAVVRDDDGNVVALPHAERAVENCLEAIRRVRASRGSGRTPDVNHVWVTVWPPIEADIAQLAALQAKITPLTEGAGIEEVLAQGRVEDADGTARPVAIRFHATAGARVAADIIEPPTQPLAPMDDYAAKVLRARRRGLLYPYELEPALAGSGSFVEYDLDDTGALVPVDRARGGNTAGMIVGLVTTPTALHPQGITRVVLAGDPIKSLGALSEAECRRVVAAIDLADRLSVPLEWFAVSAGARVSMTSGTENMDWVAVALKRIVEFTQDGGEINIVVAGINVGAQPYWNAEATMLMHTKGILVMTPDSAMVLTGKQTLDFAGSVSAEDNFGIGGYDRVMGPNGQAQYWVPDLSAALGVLMQHYEHTYVAPGEQRPRRAPTSDPVDRDISASPHTGEFATVGDVFSAEQNPDRKRPFDIRSVMRAVADNDHPMLERWAGMADAETAVTVDARIGGYPVSLIGIESKPVARHGFPPTDGPDTYTAGTLFPRSSKKVARAINVASGNRPVVVLANLSGFDGSPESMRNLQLEYGAEIGRAIVNFRGPIVFCVISRYHGGAFVVFSKRLNPHMTVLAVEGSFASVLGGAPAAAVVFASEVAKRAAADPQLAQLQQQIDGAQGAERAALVVEREEVEANLRAAKIAEIAAEFDGVHSVQRAVEVGSVDEVVAASQLRPRIVAALQQGLDTDN